MDPICPSCYSEIDTEILYGVDDKFHGWVKCPSCNAELAYEGFPEDALNDLWIVSLTGEFDPPPRKWWDLRGMKIPILQILQGNVPTKNFINS